MRQLRPSVRFLVFALVSLVLVAACSGGESERPELPIDQSVDESAANEDATNSEPEQRTQSSDQAQSEPSRRSASLSFNTPTQAGEARPLASIVGEGSLDVERIARSVVRVEPALIEGGDFSTLAFGSGSIVDRRGLILTNFHVIDPAIGHDVILIAVTGALDERPRTKFIAEVQVADATLDLAVLRIVSYLNGEPVKPSTINLTEIPQGESDAVEVLDRVLAFGYPDIGDETLTVTAGAISGFLSQEGVSARRSWFKTDTTISFGNSGGAAVDEDGYLIGIPTQGNFDEGGSIAHLRPFSLALPLIEAAQRGELLEAGGSRVAVPAQVSNLAFAAELSADGELLARSSRFAADEDQIFYSFDFQGMTPDTSLRELWLLDGVVLEPLNLTYDTWELGSAGTFVDGIQSSGGFSTGIFTLEIWIESDLIASRSFSVGGAELAAPTISNLVMAEGIGPLGNPRGIANDFKPGISTLFAFFEYANGSSIFSVNDIWYFEGEEIGIARPGAGSWTGGESGQSYVTLSDSRGFGPGQYAIEIYFDNDLVGRANFSVGAGLALPDEGLALALGEVAEGSLDSGDVALFRLTGFNSAPGPEQGLLVKMEGTGDADLYVKRGSAPSAHEFDQSWDAPDFQAPFDVGSNETVFIPEATPGDWWIAVVGYDLESDYTLRASISAGSAAGVEALTLGDSVTRVLPLEGDYDEFVLNVSPGLDGLRVVITGDGDADLYLSFGAPLSAEDLNSSWNGPDIFAPYSDGSDEFINVASPREGSWFVRVEGFLGQTTYTLTAELGVAVTPGAIGSDPFLDDLHQLCGDGDFAACDDLFFDAPLDSEYEAFGDTCGGRQPLGTGVLCTDAFGTGGSSASSGGLGDDPFLDDLYVRCEGGDFTACDDLYLEAPLDSEYEVFGDTCGGLQPEGTGNLCTEVFGDGEVLTTAFTFGDDPVLDSLWLLCADGEFTACDELYFESNSGTDYEFFGDTCGGLQAEGSGNLCAEVFGADNVLEGTFGADPVLDALYESCGDGDLSACDELYFEASPDSEYAVFGDTCGGLQAAGTGRLCVSS